MHATIPAFPSGIQNLLFSGFKSGELSGALEGLIDRGAGRLLAQGMARLIELGFGFLIADELDSFKAKKAEDFFEDNFVMNDAQAKGGIRYYQGQFLIRTSKAEDDMNVYIRFCPDISKLFDGDELNHHAIVSAEAITEEEADQLERNPNKVDLIIRFKDIKSILGLIERPDVDPVQLLLENQVQLTGNFGHMFKFGAIGKSAQQAISG
ncbi:hypothetical protein MNBD_GAMMA11-2099 [hydrothermal vent metagenome]|uniref:Uncharacterized protein n=1 Tax=hydrothermal vent metagenome TaxID=652676 RepID=A0A3B0X6T5_9ZZZZ